MPTSLDFSESEKLLISEMSKTEKKLKSIVSEIGDKELTETFNLFFAQITQAQTITTKKLEELHKVFQQLL